MPAMKHLARIALFTALAAAILCIPALAQTTPPSAGGGTPVATGGLWSLFVKSFDFFTVVLLLGSIAGVAAIFMCMMDVREQNIIPAKTITRLKDLARAKRWEDLSLAVREDDSFIARVVKATMDSTAGDKAAMREAAELAASEESARWFRRIDMLNVIGNLGPLVGLAGTVYGMILAFTSLGEAGGQAGPGDLSLGISKALFHTLLGLCLAIPCLLVYGLYRGIVDRLCTRGIVAASEIVELLPVGLHAESPVGDGHRGVLAGTIKAPSHP
jgi:biopolymer transport protein ExbB